MLPPNSVPIREACPPGACTCHREELLNNPASDARILLLTKQEEKKLIARIESISSYAELKRIEERLESQLGIILEIIPSARGVRTVRGFGIQLVSGPGLCRKTRQSIPAAVRRCLDSHPDIVYAILNAHDLLGAG
ncbi:hypothetical protein EKL30_09230 [Candidimonas sp. SYP-B2681]|nr:hypothetical protein EKL30_09230 [Candidimonas sp. SYP-B2681]